MKTKLEINSILKSIVAFSALTLSATAIAQKCDRTPRTVVLNDDTPVVVYVDGQKKSALVFPEDKLLGAEPEYPEGFRLYKSRIPYRFTVTAEDPNYDGLLTVEGDSGSSYYLRLIARNGCPDSQVTLMEPQVPTLANMVDGRMTVSGQHNQARKSLTWHLWKNELPIGYSVKNFEEYTDEELLVFKQGSLEIYLRKQVVSERLVGSTYEVVNRGRVSSTLAIEQINYSGSSVLESLGRVREISMNPMSRTLGPAPEFVSEVYTDSHRGLLFVVSEKARNR